MKQEVVPLTKAHGKALGFSLLSMCYVGEPHTAYGVPESCPFKFLHGRVHSSMSWLCLLRLLLFGVLNIVQCWRFPSLGGLMHTSFPNSFFQVAIFMYQVPDTCLTDGCTLVAKYLGFMTVGILLSQSLQLALVFLKMFPKSK